MEKPLIEIYDLQCMALIVAVPSGVRYSTQVGGLACNHPELEGVLIPLPNLDDESIASITLDAFCGSVDSQMADEIDEALRINGKLAALKIDRSKRLARREQESDNG